MKRSVLLIEDEKIMRVTLEDALKAAGYEVASFDAGKEALDASKVNPFDVVVTDVRLPDIDGFDIVREINRTKDCQIIVMTAFGTIKDAVEAMKLGAFDYITKPFALDEFLMLVERALDGKRHLAIHQGKQGVILANPNIGAGVELGTTLTHND